MNTKKHSRKSPITPERLLSDLWDARKAMALAAAVELELFTPLADGKKSAKEVATACGADLRGITSLLDALVALGYVEKKKDARYKLTELAATFLVPTSPAFMGAMVEETRMTMPGWMKLGEIVKSGKPIVAVDTHADASQFFPKLVRAIFPMSYGGARAAVDALSKKQKKGVAQILDVAAGAAPWSIAFAQALPEARVTAVDFPEVVPVAKEFAARFGVADRYEFVEGNLREVDFGRERFDLAILGHILHTEGDLWSKKLIERSARALKRGGMLLIAEMTPDEDRRGPVMPLLFGLNMLVHTEDGGVFTYGEIRAWLKSAGFRKVERLPVNAPSPLILATK